MILDQIGGVLGCPGQKSGGDERSPPCPPPNPAYMRLFQEVVLDVWAERLADAKRARTGLERRLEVLQKRLNQLDEAHVFRRAIDQISYERQRDKM